MWNSTVNSCATVFIGPPGQEQEEYTVVDDWEEDGSTYAALESTDRIREQTGKSALKVHSCMPCFWGQ